MSQIFNQQVAFGVRQKRPKCIDEAVAPTIEQESYLGDGKPVMSLEPLVLHRRSRRAKLSGPGRGSVPSRNGHDMRELAECLTRLQVLLHDTLGAGNYSRVANRRRNAPLSVGIVETAGILQNVFLPGQAAGQVGERPAPNAKGSALMGSNGRALHCKYSLVPRSVHSSSSITSPYVNSTVVNWSGNETRNGMPGESDMRIQIRFGEDTKGSC